MNYDQEMIHSSKPLDNILYLTVDNGELTLANSTFPKYMIKDGYSLETKTLTNKLDQYFNLRNKNNIENYLSTNEFDFPIFEENYNLIKSYFPDEQLVLELFHDPMDPDDELVIYIQTGLKPKDALEKIRQINRERRKKFSSKTNNMLMIDVEFQ